MLVVSAALFLCHLEAASVQGLGDCCCRLLLQAQTVTRAASALSRARLLQVSVAPSCCQQGLLLVAPRAALCCPWVAGLLVLGAPLRSALGTPVVAVAARCLSRRGSRGIPRWVAPSWFEVAAVRAAALEAFV